MQLSLKLAWAVEQGREISPELSLTYPVISLISIFEYTFSSLETMSGLIKMISIENEKKKDQYKSIPLFFFKITQ